MSASKIYFQRLQRLQKDLKANEIGALFIEHPIDLFYLTGMQMSLGHLYVKQKEARLFVDGRYLSAAKTQSAVKPAPMGNETEIAYLPKGATIAFDGGKTSYDVFASLKKKAAKAGSKVKADASFVQGLRLIKDASELAKMQKSAAFAYDAYLYIRKQCKPGVTEKEIAQKLEIYCLKKGAEKMSFEPIIAFGKNTALPHHHPGPTKLKENDIILFDLGVLLDNYCSDMTRVDFVGKPLKKLIEIHEVNKRAQKAALAKCKPGVKLKELDLAAREVMRKENLEEYFIHSLGHGVGLEVHESPRIKFDGPDRNLVLKPGMVITLEPGIYLPGKGGVRYEDTVAITEKGVENFYPT